jgi:hypothetical protein
MWIDRKLLGGWSSIDRLSDVFRDVAFALPPLMDAPGLLGWIERQQKLASWFAWISWLPTGVQLIWGFFEQIPYLQMGLSKGLCMQTLQLELIVI